MSIILAIESSTDTASVALHSSSALRSDFGTHGLSRQISGVQNHSQTILPMVQTLLAEAGFTLSQCDALAFGAGPGSFTGVRTACGIVQGLGFACDLPVIAVDTLAAAALACHDLERTAAASGENSDVLVALDARMGEVYWGQYRWREPVASIEVWEVVTVPTLSVPSAVIPVGAAVGCGGAFAVYAEALTGCATAGFRRPEVIPHAAQVARLAQRLLLEGRAIPAREAQPFYLRNNVAKTTAERMSIRQETMS